MDTMTKKQAELAKIRATIREHIISKIEGFTGSLQSVPYHLISTSDLENILSALNGGSRADLEKLRTMLNEMGRVSIE